jgi:hypothetical protein
MRVTQKKHKYDFACETGQKIYSSIQNANIIEAVLTSDDAYLDVINHLVLQCSPYKTIEISSNMSPLSSFK